MTLPARHPGDPLYRCLWCLRYRCAWPLRKCAECEEESGGPGAAALRIGNAAAGVNGMTPGPLRLWA